MNYGVAVTREAVEELNRLLNAADPAYRQRMIDGLETLGQELGDDPWDVGESRDGGRSGHLCAATGHSV